MIVIGDIHAEYTQYLKLLSRYPGQSSVQIGDFGIGFRDVPELPEGAWFFRGNHDNPEAAREHPHYLGDYGVRELDGVKFFWVSGAWSIDQQYRTEGVSWWRDEELSYAELEQAISLYEKERPDLVLTHDGPNVATDFILNRYSLHKTKPIPTRTAQALDAMWSIHQPKKWIFGHWHIHWEKEIRGTTFRCLGELDWCEVNKEKK